jgi:hypothetical protein
MRRLRVAVLSHTRDHWLEIIGFALVGLIWLAANAWLVAQLPR